MNDFLGRASLSRTAPRSSTGFRQDAAAGLSSGWSRDIMG
jgi:hypothetical protein